MNIKESLITIGEAIKRLEIDGNVDLQAAIMQMALEIEDASELKEQKSDKDVTVNAVMKAVAKYIRTARLAKELKQKTVAERCDSSIYMISKLERGYSIELDQFLKFMDELDSLDLIYSLFKYNTKMIEKKEENSGK